MSLARFGSLPGRIARAVLVTIVVVLGVSPAAAQNKKNSWEVFIYFGGFFGHDLPSATQFGEITTYRTDHIFATDPNDISTFFTPNMGLVGGVNDPNYPFTVGPSSQFQMPPCNNDNTVVTDPNDPRAPFADECDNDQESRWIYNASGIKTNGEVQTDESEFSLGIRGGYNITRHWEVELDLGFGKQRIDLTQNLDPLLTVSLNDISDPRAQDLADFYQFTWSNVDYDSLAVSNLGNGEHPNVVASRRAADPNYDIPVYFAVPGPSFPGVTIPEGETFEDVTGFVNRVFQNPTAFRNRGNQINIDNFSLSGSINYNFNTKADSRFVPYVSAGVGIWLRNFDNPWDGEDTNYFTYGGGVRFFVNEIFSFRADLRHVNYAEDNFVIEGELKGFNLEDRIFSGFGSNTCSRDQRLVNPPCQPQNVPASQPFPNLGGGGGNARVSADVELDDFFEIRIGFDVVLGGK